MDNLDQLKTIPIGSLITLPQEESDPYFNKIAGMPARLKGLMTSVDTGAFIRGLASVYQVPREKIPMVAVYIVWIAVGEKQLVQLSGWLSAELKLPNDKAQRMAREIEQDLFGPVRAELEEFWARQRKEEPGRQAQTRATEGGARNVLNLKTEKRVPLPPSMPGRGRDQ